MVGCNRDKHNMGSLKKGDVYFSTVKVQGFSDDSVLPSPQALRVSQLNSLPSNTWSKRSLCPRQKYGRKDDERGTVPMPLRKVPDSLDSPPCRGD